MGLTNRQRRFVDFYLQSWNASDAARRAGYKGDANTVGPRLLANVGVQTQIKQRMKENAMETDEIVQRLGEQARFNLVDLLIEIKKPIYDRDGELVEEKQVFELDWEKAKRYGHMIKSIAHTRDGVKIEAYDGQTALIHIGKALGILKENVEQRTTNEEVEVHLYMPEGRDVKNSG